MRRSVFEIRKIPLEEFIDLLIYLYDEENLNYIDIIGIPDGVQDCMRIGVRKEYINREEDNIPSKITEDDIRTLLN